MATILVIDDDELMRDSVALTLERAGHTVLAEADAAAGLARLASERVDLALTDLKMPRMTGIEFLAEARRVRPDVPVVLMTAFASVGTAVEAMKLGAYDYLQKPFEADDLLHLVGRAVDHARLKAENAALRAAVAVASPREMAGSSAATASLRETVGRVARSDAAVLVRGESGVGKEVVARQIHARSNRRDRPMVAVNCATLGEGGLEAELFGGGDPDSAGRIALADGGTLLLDEVGEIAPAVQARLLRVLQEGRLERPGDGGEGAGRPVDVRVIATTNRDLDAAVASGAFRRDLYYRLNVLPVDVPPLRDRPDDVPDLCRHLLHAIAKREGDAFRHIEPAAVRLMQRYPWPGNVRELRNVLERAVVLESDPGVIRAETVGPWLRPPESPEPARAGVVSALPTEPLEEVERRVILSALEKFEGHRVRTAASLGIGVRTLGMKLKRWRSEGRVAEGTYEGRVSARTSAEPATTRD